MVDSFLIGDRRFVQVNTLPVNTAGRIYLEKVFEGQFSLFATHQKIFKSEYSQFNPNGIFLASPATYLILDNGSFYEVTRKKQWLDYFIDHKKSLKITFTSIRSN
ncbi:MAG: hypothetical protein IPL49_05725 [Saprospirales bacterium]|nr:hypothetical protein [Saprospirales bacterium]